MSEQRAAQVGERIHTIMWRAKMTQTQLAGALGLTQGMVSRKLRGSTPMTVAELFTIAGALGVDVVELLGTHEGPDAVASGPSVSLPRLDSNQQPSGYGSAQVSDLAAYRVQRERATA